MKPLYDELHCYVRGAAPQEVRQGQDRREGAPIPAHLLGNMWAQEWDNVYDLVEPYKGQASLDVDKKLARRSTTRRRW